MCTPDNQVRTYKNARDIFDEFQIYFYLFHYKSRAFIVKMKQCNLFLLLGGKQNEGT